MVKIIGEQKVKKITFTDYEVAGMMIAYCSSLSVSPEQFMRVLKAFSQNTDAVMDTFKSLYRHYANIISKDDVVKSKVAKESNDISKDHSDQPAGAESDKQTSASA